VSILVAHTHAAPRRRPREARRLGVLVHRRSLAADNARESIVCRVSWDRIKARKRSHFWMSEFWSSLQLSRDRCEKVLRFFSAYSLRTSDHEASAPYLSDIGAPLKGFLRKIAYRSLQQKGLGGLYPSSELWTLEREPERESRSRSPWTGGFPSSRLCCNKGLNGRSSRSGKLCQALNHLVADPEVMQDCRANPRQWFSCNRLRRRKLSGSGSCTGLDASWPHTRGAQKVDAKACSRTWGARARPRSPLQNLPWVAL